MKNTLSPKSMRAGWGSFVAGLVLAVLLGSTGLSAGEPSSPSATDSPRHTPNPTPATSAAAENSRQTQTPSPQPAPTVSAPAGEPLTRIDRRDIDFILPERQTPLPWLPEEVDKAYVINIDGPIDMTTFETLRRKVLELRAAGGQLVIFDLDTPGGRIDAAEQIIKLIRSDLAEVRTVAYVNPNAISAGAWIAVSCDEIVMAPVAKIGDCAPIVMNGEIKGVEREKIETYIRTSFRQAAEANGYPVAVLEAMVSAHLEALHIRDTRSGEDRLADRAELDRLNAVARSDGGADETAPARWTVIEQIASSGELLTLTTSEAARLGLVAATARNLTGVERLYNVTTAPVVIQDNWSETLVSLLTSPVVTSVLVMMMFFFGSIEMRTPGFGIFGAIALACLGVLMGSRLLIGLALWWEVALFVLGVVLLMLEVFVIPGFGVAGFSGILCCVIGLLAILVGNAPDELPLPKGDISIDFFLNSLFAVGLGFVVAVILAMITGKYLPSIPIAGRLVIGEMDPVDPAAPVADDSPLLRIAVGADGVLVTGCRPSGKARFGDDIVDVATDGSYLASGSRVRVAAVRSTYLLVNAVEEA